MTFWINVLFVFLIMLPYFINGVLATYMVDSVLKYEVKHKKFVYLILALAGTVYGIFAAITSVSGSGTNIIIDLMDMMMIYGSAIIVLAININAKWWKKILISFLAIDILTSFNHIFDILSDQIIYNRTWNTRILAMVIIILCRLLFQFLEFVFLYFLKRLRSRNDNTPLPVSVTLTIAALLNIVVNVVPDLIDDANEDNARRVITITGMLAIEGPHYNVLRMSAADRMRIRTTAIAMYSSQTSTLMMLLPSERLISLLRTRERLCLRRKSA